MTGEYYTAGEDAVEFLTDHTINDRVPIAYAIAACNIAFRQGTGACLARLSSLQNALDQMILLTPTGAYRNALTDLNIMIKLSIDDQEKARKKADTGRGQEGDSRDMGKEEAQRKA